MQWVAELAQVPKQQQHKAFPFFTDKELSGTPKERYHALAHHRLTSSDKKYMQREMRLQLKHDAIPVLDTEIRNCTNEELAQRYDHYLDKGYNDWNGKTQLNHSQREEIYKFDRIENEMQRRKELSTTEDLKHRHNPQTNPIYKLPLPRLITEKELRTMSFVDLEEVRKRIDKDNIIRMTLHGSSSKSTDIRRNEENARRMDIEIHRRLIELEGEKHNEKRSKLKVIPVEGTDGHKNSYFRAT